MEVLMNNTSTSGLNNPETAGEAHRRVHEAIFVAKKYFPADTIVLKLQKIQQEFLSVHPNAPVDEVAWHEVVRIVAQRVDVLDEARGRTDIRCEFDEEISLALWPAF